MTKYIEKSSVRMMMDAFKSDAKDKQDRIEELEADVRRLEKLFKNICEDYMRLAHPQLSVDDYDLSKPFTYEPLAGGLKRRPGLKFIGATMGYRNEQIVVHKDHPARILGKDGTLTEMKIEWDKPLSFEEQMKETDALRVEVMSKIKRDKEKKEKADPWLILLKDIQRVGCISVYLLETVKDGLNLDEDHDFYVCVWDTDPSFKFIVKETGGAYLATMSSSIKDMDALKEFYNSFKELFG